MYAEWKEKERYDLIEFHADGFRIVEERISMQSHNSIVVQHTIDYIASQLLNFQINLLTHTDRNLVRLV